MFYFFFESNRPEKVKLLLERYPHQEAPGHETMQEVSLCKLCFHVAARELKAILVSEFVTQKKNCG